MFQARDQLVEIDKFDNFEHNIMKKIQEVSAEMEIFSDYIKKQCELQRMYKANKHR